MDDLFENPEEQNKFDQLLAAHKTLFEVASEISELVKSALLATSKDICYSLGPKLATDLFGLKEVYQKMKLRDFRRLIKRIYVAFQKICPSDTFTKEFEDFDFFNLQFL